MPQKLSNRCSFKIFLVLSVMLRRKKSTTQISKLSVDVGDREIPVYIYRERRSSWRIAIGQTAVNLRVPDSVPDDHSENPIEWGTKWILKKYRKTPEVFEHLFLRIPQDGTCYQTLFGKYTLRLKITDRKTATGTFFHDELWIRYPFDWSDEVQLQVLPKLISKVFVSRFFSDFNRRVAELNEKTFRFHYSDVSFRYNKSNWGSCSHDGHLTFSTRLFLAPQIVADYVILHELAHLKEHNHSAAFWSLIEQVMPDYKDHVKWLKKNGSKLYY